MTRPAMNLAVAVLVLLAGAIYYSFSLAGHLEANTFFTLHNVNDVSDAMLAPVITFMVVLLSPRKKLGRFLGHTYLVLLITGIAASVVNDMIFNRFGYMEYEILPRVLMSVPALILLFTPLVALFISGEMIVREVKSRTRRRRASQQKA
ncbi:hypothetical protein [Brevibacterium spongiae]|uniref:Uncharacterized protein n=1 Tax=Brevibacterium spongiae TaxID=2909672 RepID=A0ABY5ST60_9MICO|nr:hypothetical protein [Brevibacterium spongiae]UVI37753.1 hypothetical protein L1F31_08945 [Brevibacterium spongiae]